MVTELRAGDPDIVELLGMIRDTLTSEVLPTTSDRAQYVVRMSCRLVEIVEREIAAGPGDPVRLTERLRGLGVSSEAELAANLVNGSADPADDEIRAFIRDLVRWRIGIARPDHPDAAVLDA